MADRVVVRSESVLPRELGDFGRGRIADDLVGGVVLFDDDEDVRLLPREELLRKCPLARVYAARFCAGTAGFSKSIPS